MLNRKPIPLAEAYPDLQKMLDDKDARIKQLETTMASYAKQIESMHRDVDGQYQLRKDDAKAFREKIATIENEAANLRALLKMRADSKPPTNCMHGPICSRHDDTCDDASVPPKCFSTTIGVNKKSGGSGLMASELETTITAIALLMGVTDTKDVRSAISKQNQVSGDRPQAIANAMLVKMAEAFKTKETKAG